MQGPKANHICEICSAGKVQKKTMLKNVWKKLCDEEPVVLNKLLKQKKRCPQIKKKCKLARPPVLTYTQAHNRYRQSSPGGDGRGAADLRKEEFELAMDIAAHWWWVYALDWFRSCQCWKICVSTP